MDVRDAARFFHDFSPHSSAVDGGNSPKVGLPTANKRYKKKKECRKDVRSLTQNRSVKTLQWVGCLK